MVPVLSQYVKLLFGSDLVVDIRVTGTERCKWQHHTERSANDSTILWPVSSLWCNMCWLTQHPQYTWRRERNAQLLLCFLSKNLLSHQHSLKLSFLFFYSHESRSGRPSSHAIHHKLCTQSMCPVLYQAEDWSPPNADTTTEGTLQTSDWKWMSSKWEGWYRYLSRHNVLRFHFWFRFLICTFSWCWNIQKYFWQYTLHKWTYHHILPIDAKISSKVLVYQR